MRWAAFVMLMFCVGISLYALGYAPVINIFNINGQHLPQLIDASCQRGDWLTCAFTSQSTSLVLGTMLLLIVGGLALIQGAGFGAIYIVPMLILIAIINLFIFPLDFIYGINNLFIQTIIIGFFGLSEVIAAVNFIRGSA